jgi:hypothetical protein
LKTKNHSYQPIDRVTLLLGSLIFILISCSPSGNHGEVPIETQPTQVNAAVITTSTISPSLTPASSLPSPTSSPTHPPSPTFTSTPSLTPTPTHTPIPSLSFTPSQTPTYAVLRATVLEQSNCRYGPGAAYLYKYGLYPGNNIEIIGRNDPGTWIVIQAIGGANPCWVKASLLEIKGDVMAVAPMELPLPMSPYYGPLTGVAARRKGDTVTISWDSLVLRAGDDSLQYPYLVEAWLCQGGQLTFTPIGSWETSVTVTDEPGCPQPSHARVYGVEKHGYTLWREVPWPPP